MYREKCCKDLHLVHSDDIGITLLEPHSHMWGQNTLIISSLSPKRDCGPKRVKERGQPEIFGQKNATSMYPSCTKHFSYYCNILLQVAPQQSASPGDDGIGVRALCAVGIRCTRYRLGLRLDRMLVLVFSSFILFTFSLFFRSCPSLYVSTLFYIGRAYQTMDMFWYYSVARGTGWYTMARQYHFLAYCYCACCSVLVSHGDAFLLSLFCDNGEQMSKSGNGLI